MADEDFAPRIRVLLARSANPALEFSRGPSRVATFSWDRASGAVTLGQ